MPGMSATERRPDRSPGGATAASRERAHLLVTGVVQGVGFRWFVLERARSLALDGTVRNRPDGSVEIAAEGPREALVRLVRSVLHGPPLARVREVRARWGPAAGTPAGFHVVR